MRGALLGLALALAACALPAVPARAVTEEFSTFDPESPEQDDESVIDHLQTGFPVAWDAEWARAAHGVRASQGCLTSAIWYMDTEIRAGSPIGKRARMDVEYVQLESDDASYDHLDLWFRWPQRVGTLSGMFRPYRDKTRQDFALSWGVGADTSTFQLEAIFTFEDLFNNFWAWHGRRVGNGDAAYTRHPWEPALRMARRAEAWHAEIAGKWLTPSSLRSTPAIEAVPLATKTLWGALLQASCERRLRGAWLGARFTNRQASSTDAQDAVPGDDHFFRRGWQAELSARGDVAPRLAAQAGWFYGGRSADHAPPLDDGTFEGIDRGLHGELRWTVRGDLIARLGGVYDRVTVTKTGSTPWLTEGTRNESRLYIGAAARWGAVRVQALEGIELDPEPYPVTWGHDKTFVSMQTTF